jgi:hypothetical protein
MDYFEKIILEAKKKKKETKEATGSGSAGGFEAPLFSMFSKDKKAKKEYKKKIEATEATSSSSVGAYDAPGFEDVNMKGNNPIGRGRSFNVPQIPGGGFVEIQKKCKTFPYCSQGDSKDKPVKVRKKPTAMTEAIKNVSIRTGLSESQIKRMLLKKINETLLNL